MYLPENIVTNRDLEKTLDTTDEWIRARTGIAERRIARKDESASSMGIAASHMALQAAGLKAADLDMIIVCTSTPDVIYPATACFVQKELGAEKAAAYDISAVCSGFVFGLSIAEQYIKSGRYEHILIIGTEVNSRIMDWTDRTTCVLFGDGAGAAILRRTEKTEPCGILSSHIYSDGTQSDLLIVPGGIGKTSFTYEAIDNKMYCLKMSGQSTFKVAVKRMTEVSKEALAHNGLTQSDIDLVVPHQANQRIIEAVAEKLGVPMEQVFVNIHKYGNTGSASIAIAIHEAREEGRTPPGSVTLLTVMGAGLTWGSVVVKW
ncbi:beta-ketoacyl-ACP synthase III [Nitrospina watsonii]|uniref:Beta-ketoacyl-[acyl-carrier-protein] synthase III n=1 Tax=Nitrospina watsonii TaxID=1323948 RepID=A0ABM9HDU7_9BACT|nr:beta-ketoacyl-ACP synthase III [Nitrospina watsonii]CAI2718255.1 beta-ketoacyl-[acyl carrier protein] synthase III [Nitrospina watsonii]